jgi:plastocyanin
MNGFVDVSPMSLARRLALLTCLAAAIVAAPASATTKGPGVQHLHYKFGPLHVAPGQNTIKFQPTDLRPKVPGYITRFKPDLIYANGTKPSVDVIHLHHGVWIVNGIPTFAVGEEKTIVSLPQGYGFRYTPDESWIINYMIHNLTVNPDTVYITYDIDFVPDTSPMAAKMKPVRTQWMDVAGIRAYPVFDALRGSGKNGRFTFPDDDPTNPAVGPANSWTVSQPTTLVQTAGHLHPGGLNTYLTVTRGNKTKRIFTSKAHYWEPAGAVSWDVAMTSTADDWRVALKPGDVVKVHAVYDTSKASWYEVMGIMVMAVQDNSTAGVDPFSGKKIDMKGHLTHGRLKENIDSGGRTTGLPDPEKALDGPVATTQLTIDGFVYSQGDMTMSGMPGRPAVVQQGQPLTFLNSDAQSNIYHTITACKLPCNKSAGIGYPLANGPVQFDSGELGFGNRFASPAKGTDTWSTPSNLPVGTYSYFCRVHPFMRGTFRVVPAKRTKA